MSKSTFKEILRNPLMEFDSVTRYSGVYSNNPDNDSKHTYRVMLIGLTFINKLNNENSKVSKEKFLHKAFLHDMPEVFINDIPRPVKHFNSDVENAIKNIEVSYAEKLSCYGLSSEDIDLIKNDKDLSPEGILLRIVDLLDVAYFATREVKIENNFKFLKVTTECLPCIEGLITFIKDMYSQSFITIAERELYMTVVLDCIYILKTVNSNFKDLINSFNLTSRSLVTNH